MILTSTMHFNVICNTLRVCFLHFGMLLFRLSVRYRRYELEIIIQYKIYLIKSYHSYMYVKWIRPKKFPPKKFPAIKFPKMTTWDKKFPAKKFPPKKFPAIKFPKMTHGPKSFRPKSFQLLKRKKIKQITFTHLISPLIKSRFFFIYFVELN